MEIIYSEQSTFQGPNNVISSVKYGLLKDKNYTLKVTVASADGSSYSSKFAHFGGCMVMASYYSFNTYEQWMRN